MNTKRLSLETVRDQILDFVDQCDSEELAALYQDIFGAVKSADYVIDELLDEHPEYIEVEYNEGCGPEDVP